jgi:hypothetical protein
MLLHTSTSGHRVEFNMMLAPDIIPNSDVIVPRAEKPGFRLSRVLVKKLVQPLLRRRGE